MTQEREKKDETLRGLLKTIHEAKKKTKIKITLVGGPPREGYIQWLTTELLTFEGQPSTFILIDKIQLVQKIPE